MSTRPSLRQRLALARDAVRGIWQGPIYSSDPNLREFFGSNQTATGVSVSEGNALTVAAVWNAVNCISGDIAALPLNMYRRFDGGKEKFLNNPMHRLVHDQPNPEMTAITWRRTIQAHALTWGNGYSEIVRDGSGRPSALWPITPDRVTPYRRGIDSGLEYRIVNRDGSDDFIPDADMLHIKGLGFDGIQGYSVIAKARESIGLGMAAEQFGSTMYGNGLSIGGVISFPGAKPPELSDKNYIESLNRKHQGVERAHKLLALYNGAKYERMNIPPNDAQFLETRTFQLAEVARWFNLPPHKIGDLHRATFSNIEQQTIDYYTGCLLPWLKTWEQELFTKLVPSSERNIQFFEHVVDGLLRGDSQMRADSFSKRFSTGSVTPNEIRDAENLNPIPGGDTAFVPLNTIPANLVQAWFQADIKEKEAKAEQALRPPPVPVAPPPAAPDPNKAREIELLTEARDTARRCAQEAEDAKDIKAAEVVAITAELSHCARAWEAECERGRVKLAEVEGERDRIASEANAALMTSASRASVIEEQLSEITRLTAHAGSFSADLDLATRDLSAAVDRIALIEADYQRVCGEKTTLEAEAVSVGVTLAALESERNDLKSQTEGLSLDVAEAQREARDAQDQIAVLEGEAVRLSAERASEDAALLSQTKDLRGQIEAVTQKLDSVTTDLVEAKAVNLTLEAAHTAARTVFEADAQKASEARAHADEVNAATVAELRARVQSLTEEDARRITSMTELAALATRREVERDEQATMNETSATALRAALAQIEAASVQRRAVQDAIRGTVVDAAQRLIEKESARARKAQGSPEKLGAWVHTFYPLHEDYCRELLKPAVRALLIAHGADVSVDRVLDRIVPVHIGESARQLQIIIQECDVESLAPALEKVLRRWESERAETLADRILKEVA